MRRVKITELITIAFVVILIMIALAPSLGRLQRSPSEAKCQSNLRIWARAMALYVADNNESYPLNKYQGSSSISSDVMLSSPSQTNSDGTPLRFQYGLNWVEALYPYVQERVKKTGQDWKSFRACPSAGERKQPMNSNACMSYSFNYNLVGQPKGIVRYPAKTMMIRELDRLYNSVLRPANSSSAGFASPPLNLFLDTADEALAGSAGIYRATNPKLHGSGSYIAFADGHIHYFTTDYFPGQVQITSARCWDTETQGWYNYVFANPQTDQERMLNKSIAITP